MPSRPAGWGASPALAVAGFVMLCAVFLKANRIEGLDAATRAWPWEMAGRTEHPWSGRATFGLWMLLALGAITLAFGSAWRFRSAFLLSVGTVLFVQCTAGLSGLTITVHNFNQLAPLVMTTGGLLLARHAGTRTTGRALAALGAALLLWSMAVGFDEEELSLLGGLRLDLRSLFTGEDAVTGTPGYHWKATVPRALLVLGAVLALVTAASARAPRWLHLGAVVLLGAGLAVPLLGELSEGTRLTGGVDAQRIVRDLGIVLVQHGFALWLVLSLAIADAGRGRWEAS
jgi:hypothetical protein